MGEFSGAAPSMSGIVTSANGLVARKADTAYLRLSGRGRGWGGHLFEVGANSKLGAYSNKYGKLFQFSFSTSVSLPTVNFRLYALWPVS